MTVYTSSILGRYQRARLLWHKRHQRMATLRRCGPTRYSYGWVKAASSGWLWVIGATPSPQVSLR